MEIETVGLGKKPSGDLALRRLASAVLMTAMIDLMDGAEQKSATQFFYSSDVELWCGILGLNIGCVRVELEELGLLSHSTGLISGITRSDMMRHYIELCEDSTESNLEVLLELSHQLKIPYALVHFYIYDQILAWKPVLMRLESGPKFFKMWKSHVSSQKGRGSSSRFGLIIESFRKRLAEGHCG